MLFQFHKEDAVSYYKHAVVSGVSAAEMVAALYNVAVPADLARYEDEPMMLQQAEALLAMGAGTPFWEDYVMGRPVKIVFSNHPHYSYENFERYNGEGVFTVVVKILQEYHDVWHPIIQRLHYGGLRAMAFDPTYGGRFAGVQHLSGLARRHLVGYDYYHVDPLTLPEVLGGDCVWK